MSKLKTPQEKKVASLIHDGRDAYRENDKASRKLIPKGKQRSHQAFRRQARQPLAAISTALPEDQIVAAESVAIESEIRNKRTSFKKLPDVPLGYVLDCKRSEVHIWRGGRSADEIVAQEKRKRRA